MIGAPLTREGASRARGAVSWDKGLSCEMQASHVITHLSRDRPPSHVRGLSRDRVAYHARGGLSRERRRLSCERSLSCEKAELSHERLIR